MVDWGDPETFRLNVANVALGLATLIALLAIMVAVVREAAARIRSWALTTGHTHRASVPDLGGTVADGGEEVQKPEEFLAS